MKLKLRPNRRNPNKLSLYLDGRYFTSLSRDLVLKLGITTDEELTEEQVDLLGLRANEEKARSYALRLLSYRPRSKNELLERLTKKGYPQEIIRKVVENLAKENLISDYEYAKSIVRHYLNFRLKGRHKIIYELKKRGISEEIINQVLKEINPEEELRALKTLLAKKLMSKTQEPSKLKARLMRSGFSLSLINKVLHETR
ncbi:MAG: RecX family transcriptional regulator [candidate division WOR-3 bacterium]